MHDIKIPEDFMRAFRLCVWSLKHGNVYSFDIAREVLKQNISILSRLKKPTEIEKESLALFKRTLVWVNTNYEDLEKLYLFSNDEKNNQTPTAKVIKKQTVH